MAKYKNIYSKMYLLKTKNTNSDKVRIDYNPVWNYLRS